MTLEADYAVRIVEYLTRHPGRWDARTISEAMDVPKLRHPSRSKKLKDFLS